MDFRPNPDMWLFPDGFEGWVAEVAGDGWAEISLNLDAQLLEYKLGISFHAWIPIQAWWWRVSRDLGKGVRVVRSIFEQRCYWMLVAIATLMFCLLWGQVDMAPVQAELGPGAGGFGAAGLITHFHEDVSGGPTRVIVVDPTQKRMAVYHVPTDSGEIQLKSVRNLTVDLQVQEFNSGDPSPVDMQKTLQRN